MSTESTGTMKRSLDDLSTYAVDPKSGFLPPQDPPQRLSSAFLAWEQVARELPKLLVSGSIRRILDDLPVLDPSPLARRAEQERAMLLLSYLGHAYVWGEVQPSDRIPACLSLPWHQVAHQVGRRPILSYASYALWNWKRIDVDAPIALGNIILLQNFLGGLDEEWFILVHVAIEAAAAPAIAAIPLALAAAGRGDVQVLTAQLTTVAAALAQMNRVLARGIRSLELDAAKAYLRQFDRGGQRVMERIPLFDHTRKQLGIGSYHLIQPGPESRRVARQFLVRTIFDRQNHTRIRLGDFLLVFDILSLRHLD